MMDLALALLIGVACWTDIRTRKIKNWLTFPVMAFGCAAWLVPGLSPTGVLGVLAGFVVCLPLWRIGPVFSAGDVKMVMAGGALLGPENALRAVLFALVLGLPAGLVTLALKRRLRTIPAVLAGKAEPTMLWHAPVIGAGLLAARAQAWPDLW